MLSPTKSCGKLSTAMPTGVLIPPRRHNREWINAGRNVGGKREIDHQVAFGRTANDGLRKSGNRQVDAGLAPKPRSLDGQAVRLAYLEAELGNRLDGGRAAAGFVIISRRASLAHRVRPFRERANAPRPRKVPA